MTAKTSSAEIKSVLIFRDAGGMLTTDGRRIKENVIFRSANPDKISRGDIKKLYDLDIRTIVDLRADYEGGNKKRRFEGIETISLPLDFEQTTRERLIPHFKRKHTMRKILSLGFFPSDKILFAVTVRDNNIRSVMDRVMTQYEGIEGYLSMSGPVNSEFKKLRERFVI